MCAFINVRNNIGIGNENMKHTLKQPTRSSLTLAMMWENVSKRWNSIAMNCTPRIVTNPRMKRQPIGSSCRYCLSICTYMLYHRPMRRYYAPYQRKNDKKQIFLF